MGGFCSRRRRLTQEDADRNPNIVPIMHPEQEPQEWEFVELQLDHDEDQMWQIHSFDDSMSESSSDEQADVSAGPPPPMPTLEYPNLRRGRLVLLGFNSSSTTMPADAVEISTASSSTQAPVPAEENFQNAEARRRFRRAMHRWQHARMHLTRVLRLRRIWANLGRVLSSWPHSDRNSPEYRKAASIWGSLGRTLQRLNSSALTCHVCRRKGKLVRRFD